VEDKKEVGKKRGGPASSASFLIIYPRKGRKGGKKERMLVQHRGTESGKRGRKGGG